MTISRRDFIKLSAAASAVGLAGFPMISTGAAAKRVVVVGGGTGGATAAKYIKMFDPSIEVTLVEPNAHHYTCSAWRARCASGSATRTRAERQAPRADPRRPALAR